jgi:hypothetical protein
MMNVAAVIGTGLGGFAFGLYLGLAIGMTNDRSTFKKCRYYDQTIERCVAELGWEKK